MIPLVITARALRKTFTAKTKDPGLRGSIRSVLKPNILKIDAVKGVDFHVESGEVVAFIGPNGAGKSTAIKMLTGILYPTAGEATVLGLVPWENREKLSYKIGSVFGQKSQLWYHLPPLDTFNLLAKIYEMDPAQEARRRHSLVEAFEIQDFLKIPVRKLSLGQRMRCEVAASLLHGPKVIFLDEPTIGLDVVARQNVRETLKQWNSVEKTTVFLTSHDVGDIEYLADRVIIINRGQLVLDSDVKTLKRSHLSKKIVDLRLEGTCPDFTIPGVTVLKSKGSGVKLEINLGLSSVDRALSAILDICKIQDIVISDPPLESIIASIYTSQLGGE